MISLRGPKLLLVVVFGASAAACARTVPAGSGPGTSLIAPRQIGAGQTLTGSLGESDPRLEDGSRYDLYAFHGEADEEVEVSLYSDDFDAYLALGQEAGGELKIVASDDDGAGELNARISTVLPRTGRYVVRANSVRSGETGDYRLELVSHGLVPEPSRTAISAGETLAGHLSPADARLPAGSYYDLWTVNGSANEVVRIDLTSEDFDSFLALGTERDGAFDPLQTDDDGGDGLNSRLYATLPARGEYVVRASSLGRRTAGAYQLQVTSEGPARPAARESIGFDEAREGELSSTDARLEDGSFHDLWTFRGTAGEEVRVELSSDEFDAYLQIGTENGGGFEELASDDDGGAELNSRIRMTLPQTGEYVIRAQSLRPGQTGAYRVRLSTPRAEPPASRETIALDEPRTGTLADSDSRLENDAHHDLWVYHGRAGETIQVDLVSDDFDTYIRFGYEQDGRFRELEVDDDGGDGTNSSLHVSLTEDRPYIIRATSFAPGDLGAYRITVSTAPHDG